MINTYKQKRIPNTSVAGYGRDFIENFKLGCSGRDIFTNHLTQDYDWRNNDFTYDWNSYGWRGPEPDFYAKKKMLFAIIVQIIDLSVMKLEYIGMIKISKLNGR